MSKDMINPAHYKTASGLEAYQVMEAFGLLDDHYVATAVKYLLRLGKKDPIEQDLKKAIWYLNRKLELVQDDK